ncbi:DUF4912 domain-containing protein [Halarcobacter ebronensis]|uniref:DUF4912 domain-containing protein n=1 Tax=Halarcobacter ebronensis TaxID=1462615 RepID=A0A4Q1AKC0_9BACT|nr:DUF4912 domain-containing protein [Halarcobacter ebronensis]QKF83234.1 DUF4912 domain-containing protein [Halarcobacter ebronensis]RXK05131.1 hypothetical protein CRV07_08930 [Halarcobacter ebronensis]
MFKNSENLIKESLENENDFSSATHVIDNLVAVNKPKATEYKIPERYNKDTLRIILVNTEKYFVYWEVSDKTLAEKSIDLNKEKLYFKVDDINGDELYSFESSLALGDYYVNSEFENKDIFVKAGVIKNGEFIELISSNVIHTFSSKINFPSQEEYEELLKKGYSWTEIIRTTIEHFDMGTSSAKYVQELERLKHFIQEEEKDKFSSSSFLGKSND